MELERIEGVICRKYPLAQAAFLEFEVYEQAQSRVEIREFAKVFELLSNAALEDDERFVEEAGRILDEITIRNLSYLCDVRFKEIKRIIRHGKLFYFLAFDKNPLIRPDVKTLLSVAISQYAAASDEKRTVEERARAFQEALSSLENLLCQLEPHRIYDAVFSWALGLVVALISGLITFRYF